MSLLTRQLAIEKYDEKFLFQIIISGHDSSLLSILQ